MNIAKYGLVFVLLWVGASQAQSKAKLVPLNVDPNSITVSGLSSGGFMAVQLHVALSSVFKGAASVAGGIYWCAQGNMMTAQMNCMNMPSMLDTGLYLKKAQSEAQARKIESLENIKTSRVFIYASKRDTVVNPVSSDKLYEFYSKLMPARNIKYKNDVPSGHGWVTNRFGTACGTQASPWISNCHYDLAADILTHFYGQMRAPAPTTEVKKQMFAFDQNEFQTPGTSLYDTGYVYVPKACQARGGTPCKLHVNLHGCQMGPNYLNDEYVLNSGLNEWAETNGMVVLYPQVTSTGFNNPYGCWDWFGYTGPDYANKGGKQIIAIQKMVYRLIGKF